MANSRNRAYRIENLRFGCQAIPWDRASPAMVIVAGIICQFCDSTVAPAETAFVKMHTLFGLLLCCAVLIRFNDSNRRSSGRSTSDICNFYRRQKRLVYLLLYGLAGVKQVINMMMYLRHGGGTAPDGSSGSAHATTHAAAFPPFDDFQIYVVYGILAILLIRILAGVWNSQSDSPGGMRPGFANTIDLVRTP